MNLFIALLAAVAIPIVAEPTNPCDVRAFSGNFLFILNPFGVSWYNINNYKTNKEMNDAIDVELAKIAEAHKGVDRKFREMKLFYSRHYQHAVVVGVHLETNEFHIGVVPLKVATGQESHFYPFTKMEIGPYTLADGTTSRLIRIPPNTPFNGTNNVHVIPNCKEVFSKSVFNRLYFGQEFTLIIDPNNRSAKVNPHNITDFKGMCPADTYKKPIIENQNEDDRDFHILAKKIDGIYQVIFESRDPKKADHTCLLRNSGTGETDEARMLMYPRKHGEKGVSVHFPEKPKQ